MAYVFHVTRRMQPTAGASAITSPEHVYEIRPRKDHRSVNLISDTLPFGRLWYGEPNAVSNAVDYAKFFRRSHRAVIRVYDAAGNVIRDARSTRRFQGLVILDFTERFCVLTGCLS